MKKSLLIAAIAVLVGAAGVAAYRFWPDSKTDGIAPSFPGVADSEKAEGQTGENGNLGNGRITDPEVVAQNLDIPWELTFLPDGSRLVTERPGTLKRLGKDGFAIPVSGTLHIGEGGLLGMVLHPDFSSNNWLYLYFTTRRGGATRNVVERYKLSGDELSEQTVIVDNIPAGSNHDGGRVAFGPDGFLYVTTGDSGNGNLAQDTNSLAGKILRVRDDGSIPEDNPFGSPVYSYGHRNAQGLDWDDNGQLWATEHGRSGILSGYDELNLIKRGANYGWPVIQGGESREGMETPVINSGPTTTWAPSGAAYFDGSIFFAGLRGRTLYEYKIAEEELTEHLDGQYGRLRQVVVGPDKIFYVLTSNTDGRGRPGEGDDKIIRFSPAYLSR